MVECKREYATNWKVDQVTPDEHKIRETLKYLADGIDTGSIDLVNRAFHPNAQLFYNTKQGFMNVSIEEFCEALARLKENSEHPINKEKSIKNIIYIDIAKDAAAVKMEWHFKSLKYTDYYNLLKISDRWYIINKVFSSESAQN
ncbi:MAG: nuclear transport factor 2 family protein [Clostridia bacterium]|nr:nuclear transport factor 2 family protein [Clostridia bacterium]